ncbi:Hypothetical_protein [Hexamita inflata]|uniref:Hypothetical_protein n=1 Tax=Hexamita inflata TaxID=28002 RepID=A0AA86R3M7_9EUKA|nr:Hypothetical protein HINF_LOCUS52869 [Hexamita inflata]
MIEYFVLFSLQAQMSACEWQLSGRIWYSTQSCLLDAPLNLSKIKNPALSPSTDFADIDASVVTAVQMGQDFADNNQYSQLLDIGPSGALSNGIIILNTSIEVDQYVESLYVSVFGSFQGSLDNISLSGMINVSVPKQNKLKSIFLSTFIGNAASGMNTTISFPTETDFTFRNVSSAVKYFINKKQVPTTPSYLDADMNVTDQQTALPILLQTTFDDDQIPIPTTEVNYDQLIKDSYDFVDSVRRLTFEVTTWSSIKYMNNGKIDNQFINAFEDLYPNSLQIQLEKFYETKGMTVRRFDSNNNELELANDGDSNVVLTIYQENTKAVAIRQDTRMVICEHPNLYDIQTKSCVPTCASPKFVFQSTCVPTCPTGFYSFKNECFVRCPYWLGAGAPSTGFICDDCTSQMQKGSSSGCIAVCSANQMTFQEGCYDFCPLGTLKSGNICTQPNVINECPGKFLVLQGLANPSRFYNYCSEEEPHWMYKIVDANQIATGVFKASCSGTVLISKECVENSIVPPSSDCPIKDQSTCRQACLNISTDVNVEEKCVDLCPDFSYEQNMYGVCHMCMGAYDGGQYYSGGPSKCFFELGRRMKFII